MDIADAAQKASAPYHEQARRNRLKKNEVPKPLRTDSNGEALCICCDINIAKRREVIPNAQRCADCQHDHEKRNSKRG